MIILQALLLISIVLHSNCIRIDGDIFEDVFPGFSIHKQNISESSPTENTTLKNGGSTMFNNLNDAYIILFCVYLIPIQNEY